MASELNANEAPNNAVRNPGEPNHGVFVQAGQDRFMKPFYAGGRNIPTDCKVSTQDSHGGMYLYEHTNMGKGGPPRHVHFEQDEFFYAIKGEFIFEVGDEKFRLKTGDSIFAPRKIPHVWAHVGDTPGSLLVALQPAGTFEAFFQEGSRFTQPPTREEVEKLFAAHEMQVVGDPLPIE